MGINVNNLTPSQAKELWRDYNNGNKNELSRAEYASLCTKFDGYITQWEQQDENSYTYRESGEERLDFDEKDAGIGLNKDTAVGVGGTAVAAGGALVAGEKILTKTSEKLCFNVKGNTGIGKGIDQANAPEGTNVQGSLLVAAAAQLAAAILVTKNSPNEEAVKACEAAQNELYTEQAILAEQVATMEEMQDEMTTLQEEAEARNEEGQATIGGMEGMYHYYYTKYQSGKATSQDIALMNALAAQMQVEQASSTEETGALNEEIAAVGEGYETVSENIEVTNEFTDYVSEFDQATKVGSLVQGGLMTLSMVSAGATALKCFSRASALAGSIFGSWAAVLYVAAGAAATGAMGMFAAEAKKQFVDNRKVAEQTIDIREQTQELSTETTEFQEVSTEFWEESVDATSTENLFTMTATYADQTALTTGAKGGTRTSDVAGGNQAGNSRSTGTGQAAGTNQTATAQGAPTTPQTGQEDDGKKKKV